MQTVHPLKGQTDECAADWPAQKSYGNGFQRRKGSQAIEIIMKNSILGCPGMGCQNS
jgi:hypothetical protein